MWRLFLNFTLGSNKHATRFSAQASMQERRAKFLYYVCSITINSWLPENKFSGSIECWRNYIYIKTAYFLLCSQNLLTSVMCYNCVNNISIRGVKERYMKYLALNNNGELRALEVTSLNFYTGVIKSLKESEGQK